MLAAASLDTTLSIGTLTFVIATTAAGVTVLLRVRGKTKDAVVDTADKAVDNATRMAAEWRESYLAERQLREDAQAQAAEQREAKHQLRSELEGLRKATDLTGLMRQLADNHQAYIANMSSLEERMVTHFNSLTESTTGLATAVAMLTGEVKALREDRKH